MKWYDIKKKKKHFKRPQTLILADKCNHFFKGKALLTFIGGCFDVSRRKEQETSEGCPVVLVVPYHSAKLHGDDVARLQLHSDTVGRAVLQVGGSVPVP